ncbi:hypothetical protein [Corynebacterium neomassiliense]|uniref:hypothetical protein n=1 Tax=Corynebacterium neomassiliense TaxID=2079482 RepID=UPI0010309D02|nr:hypothetical protein [Corynebacterium neomassiliense]
MTDITNQDIRSAREWAQMTVANDYNSPSDPWAAAARVILATVDAPEPTLAEDIRAWAEKHYTAGGKTAKYELLALADRVEQIERDLAEARAEVDRLTAERTSKESLPAGLPDPADVKPGEVWLVSVGGGEPCPGFRRGDGHALPWVMSHDDTAAYTLDDCIRLVRRLVPAPRAITNPDELDTLADGSVILSEERERIPWQRREGRWFSAWAPSRSSDEIILPVTVLWEPEK